MNQITTASAKLLDFIAASQNPDGGFSSLSFPANGAEPATAKTTFTTSLILGCLDGKDLRAKHIIERGLGFLKHEQGGTGGWNYWQRLPENDDKRCPDDWDDTACALIALTIHRPAFITPELLATLTRWLIATEERPGGPYHTWFIGSDRGVAWHDLDPVANANIAYFLKLHDIRVPGLAAFLETFPTPASRYYDQPLVLSYFLSRGASDSVRKRLCSQILNLRQAGNTWGEPLHTALAVSSLLRLGLTPPPEAIAALISAAEAGVHAPTRLYIEEIPDQPNYSGAASLTAAFIYEALAAWQQSQRPAAPATSAADPLLSHHSTIVHAVRKRLKCLPASLQPEIAHLLDRIVLTDTGQQITVLPACFSAGLRQSKTNPDELMQLGIANLAGWIAYTIYDDLLDDDAGPDLLPAANLCLRDTVTIYETLLPAEAKPLFQKLMDAMERANAWERLACRLPNKSILTAVDIPAYPKNVLADKSLPHALGPITILLRNGYAINSPEIKNLLSFFTHYLTARQLNDDAHDCFDDLKKGFINSVAAGLLRRALEKWHTPLLYPLRQQRRLRQLFWEEEIDSVIARIFRHLRQARRCLSRLSPAMKTDFLEKLLIPIEQATNEAAVGKQETLGFLAAFKQSAQQRKKPNKQAVDSVP